MENGRAPTPYLGSSGDRFPSVRTTFQYHLLPTQDPFLKDNSHNPIDLMDMGIIGFLKDVKRLIHFLILETFDDIPKAGYILLQ